MLSPLDPARDLRLSGQVIYTGHSSMEVAVKMESIGTGKPDETVMIGEPITRPFFALVFLDLDISS